MSEEKTQPQGQEAMVEDKIGVLVDEIDGMAGNAPVEDAPAAQTKRDEEREETEVIADPDAAGGDGAKQKKTYKIKWGGQEREVGEDELVQLAQQGYDYTVKTQRLAEKERSLAPLEGLAKTIETDPAFATYLREYFLKSQGVRKEAEKESEPAFDDPIDKLKYDIERKLTDKFQRELSEKEKLFAHQLTIQRVRQQVERDPDFQAVTELMLEHIKSLPEPTGRVVFLQWDQDPDAYLKAFKHYKSVVSALRENGAKKQPEKQTTSPEVTRREEKAPLLESSGSGEPPDKTAERKKQLSKMKARALRSGDPLALADWLAESGAIDNLL